MSENRTPRLDTPRDSRRRSLRPRRHRDSDTFGVFAENFARYMGTARFLFWMTVLVTTWITWNVLAPAQWRWDDYPFIFLTLILSLQASYAAPLIILAQNRQENRDKVLADNDRRVNAQSQADMEFLSREIAWLRMSVGEVATRDFIRSELKSLVSDLEERVVEELERSRTSARPETAGENRQDDLGSPRD
ncbi:DUF1003 domain-containing protein [Nocardioides gilvus]|uniref:DUF1003 domain-containing protein n=1 Tax=Nocardioides gilvus TaxID=1735589 RepID=UPI000D74CE50|nr:DUF1003 domain-containing protein [Nocardioides gilvus]